MRGCRVCDQMQLPPDEDCSLSVEPGPCRHYAVPLYLDCSGSLFFCTDSMSCMPGSGLPWASHGSEPLGAALRLRASANTRATSASHSSRFCMRRSREDGKKLLRKTKVSVVSVSTTISQNNAPLLWKPIHPDGVTAHKGASIDCKIPRAGNGRRRFAVETSG